MIAQPQPACDPSQICLDDSQRAQLGIVAEPDLVATENEVETPDAPLQDGEIIVTGEVGAPEGDPAEELNAATYAVATAVDEALVEPIANVYSNVLPKPIRNGIGNFLANLGEPVNALHHLLQLKPGKAVKSLGRFAINTTIGVAGLIDVAEKKPFNLEYEPNGLANTLGVYGVGPGPYFYLPGIGSTTVRDLIGRFADLSVIPTVAGKPFNQPRYAIPVAVLNTLDHRVEVDDQLEAIRSQCGDPYAASRDLYLAKRRADIARLRGRESEAGVVEERLSFNCDFTIENGRVDFKREIAEEEADLRPETVGSDTPVENIPDQPQD